VGSRADAEPRGTWHGKIIPRTVKQAFERYAEKVAPTHRGARCANVRCDEYRLPLLTQAPCLRHAGRHRGVARSPAVTMS
jgi:hypothetical protein